MAKRGPKRKMGARQPCGKLRPRPLEPTRELVAKRIARLVIAGVSPTESRALKNTGLEESKEQPEFFRLASSWLGVLYAANVIDQHQFRAGQTYHANYKQMLPQGFPGSSASPDTTWVKTGSGSYVPVQEWESDAERATDEAWRAASRILEALGRRTHELVKNICAYGRFERFIDVSSPRPKEAWRADAEDRTRFICGLDALAMAYGYKAAQLEQRLAA